MSQAKTVQAYLDELPEERRAVVAAVRAVIRKHLPRGYEEAVNYGMISYQVPLKRYPDTYNGQPLGYMALAAQKNHYALYVMCVYASGARRAWLKEEFARAGKKFDMGKSCLRFKRLDDLPLDVIGQVAALASVEEYIAGYEASLKK